MTGVEKGIDGEKYPKGAKCTCCGVENYSTAYTARCREKQIIDRDKVCFSCAFWIIRSESKQDCVIAGHLYSPGNGLPPSRFLGMAGRRFDIEYFDGRKVTTFDLWSGGTIPEIFRDRIPDTAKFREPERTGSRQVGETTCFNPSNHKLPCWPLPNGRAVPERLEGKA